MADPLLSHQRHALINGPVRRNANDMRRHDLADQSLARGLAEQDHLACVVPLGEDALDGVTRLDEKRTDVLVGHQMERIVNGVIRPDGKDDRLAAQEISNGGRHERYPRELAVPTTVVSNPPAVSSRLTQRRPTPRAAAMVVQSGPGDAPLASSAVALT